MTDTVDPGPGLPEVPPVEFDEVQADPYTDPAAEFLEDDDAPLNDAPPEFAGAAPGEAREDQS